MKPLSEVAPRLLVIQIQIQAVWIVIEIKGKKHNGFKSFFFEGAFLFLKRNQL